MKINHIKDFKNHKLYPFIRKIAGIILIILGILGLFLPFLQGIAMIILGSMLLGNKWILKKAEVFKAWWNQKFNQK